MSLRKDGDLAQMLGGFPHFARTAPRALHNSGIQNQRAARAV
ncbi:MAG TPA: hypothetical protein VN743_00395 [Blastocatellia bacterium]|nr:hypothetical protein [Blastocatellia bacterium]